MHLKGEISENVQFMSSQNEIKRLKRQEECVAHSSRSLQELMTLKWNQHKSQRHAREPKAISACFVLKSHVVVTTTLFCL